MPTGSAPPRVEGRVVLAGGLGPENVESRDRVRAAVVRGREPEPRGRAGDQGSRSASRVRGGGAMNAEAGLYGAYGGRYVPETLVPALDELEAGWDAARRRSCVPRRARRALARRTSAARLRSTRPNGSGRGAAPYLKREDLCHTGAHKINNAVGQALLARAARQAAHRGRDRRRPARRRVRNRLRAVRLRVRRLHGRGGHATASARTSSACACSVRRSGRSSSGRRRSRRRRARRSATGSRTSRRRTT